MSRAVLIVFYANINVISIVLPTSLRVVEVFVILCLDFSLRCTAPTPAKTRYAATEPHPDDHRESNTHCCDEGAYLDRDGIRPRRSGETSNV